MNRERTLFHANDPETSRETARRAAWSNERLMLVWSAVSVHPMTAAELDVLFPEWPTRTGARRLSELRNLGWVKDSGDRRRTDTGSTAVVWESVRPEAAPKWERAHPAHLLESAAARWNDEADRRWACPFPSCRDRRPPINQLGLERHLVAVHGARSERS